MEQMGQIKGMYQALQKSANPKGMLEQMLSSNPQMKMVQNQINQYGDPKIAFFNVAHNMGLTDEQIQNGLDSVSQMLKV